MTSRTLAPLTDPHNPSSKTTGDDLSKSRHVTVDHNASGQRVDNFLVRHCPGVPRSHLYQIIRKGRVLVNGKRVKQTRRLVAGEQVRIPALRLSPASTVVVPDKLINLISQSILHEHEDFIVLNKPPGVAVHAGSGLSFGVIDVLRQQQRNPQLELSHRLDRDTSGCLLVGRNLEANRQLQVLFRERLIEKHYIALVDGVWPQSTFTVNAPLLKNVEHAGERRVMVDAAGLPAITHFRVLDRTEDVTLLDVRLETGRTHQIRVHTCHAGHCVVGDKRYGNNRRNAYFKRQGLARLFLHASALSFLWKGQRIGVQAPVDGKWNSAMKKIGISC